MLNRFKHKVEELRGLIDYSRSAPFLLAVSGGMDSMCLAELWLRAYGADSFAVAHCNFHLRGEDSEADEALVTTWSESNAVKLHKVSFDTMKYVREEGVSVEMAARDLRYNWFAQLCEDYGYAAVVTAHHADDNAETMILNMVRGTGLTGISGMKPVSPLSFRPTSPLSFRPTSPLSFRPTEGSGEISLLRPLLSFTRRQIEGYVFANKIPYREDKTNASVEYRRNSIRHEVLPVLERMNPSVVRTLNREMAYFSDASSIVDDWCRTQVPKVLEPHCEEDRRTDVAISIPKLMAIPQWRYLLYYILQPYGFNTSVLESIESLLTSDRTVSGKRFEAPDYVLLTERDTLVVMPLSSRPTSPLSSRLTSPLSSRPASPLSFRLTSPLSSRPASPLSFRPTEGSGEIFIPVRAAGTHHVNGSLVVVETLAWTPDMPKKQPDGTLIFDASRLRFPFVLRKWRAGDWMIPFGMKGKKKISDLFADLKLTHAEKEQSVILVDCTSDMAEQQHVAAVLGMRIDDRYKVTDRTKQIIRITLFS